MRYTPFSNINLNKLIRPSVNLDEEYDKEMERLNENRIRLASFKKERAIAQAIKLKKSKGRYE